MRTSPCDVKRQREGQIQWRGIDWLQKPNFVNFKLISNEKKSLQIQKLFALLLWKLQNNHLAHCFVEDIVYGGVGHNLLHKVLVSMT